MVMGWPRKSKLGNTKTGSIPVATAMNRVCANCQKEFNIKPSSKESHGICKRHYILMLKTAGFSDNSIKKSLSSLSDDEFCKDLSK